MTPPASSSMPASSSAPSPSGATSSSWPLAAWPDVPRRFVLCTHDRMFPAPWLRRVVRQRLGLVPDELDSGHTPALSHPDELVRLLTS